VLLPLAAAALALLGLVGGAALILLVAGDWGLVAGVALMLVLWAPLVATKARERGRRFL
jgi:hypothetical protein